MAFYTSQGHAPVDLRLDSYGEDDKPRPSPAEIVPLLVDFGDAEVIGEPEVRHLDLPVGPAVRIRTTLRTKSGRLGLSRGRRTELLKYAVFPPGA